MRRAALALVPLCAACSSQLGPPVTTATLAPTTTALHMGGMVTPEESRFVADVRQTWQDTYSQQLPVASSLIIDSGNAMCKLLDTGASVDDLVSDLATGNNDRAKILADQLANLADLCPEHGAQINAWITQRKPSGSS